MTTLNGAFEPVITIAPGEKQFFRVVNATGHKTLKLSTGGDLVVVAIDGFALDTWPTTPPTETVKSIVIPPAARAEFVVTGPKNGYGSFRTLCYDTGFERRSRSGDCCSPRCARPRVRADATRRSTVR